MSSVMKTYLACLMYLFSAGFICGQIVNIEDKRIQLDTNKIIQGQFDMNSKLTQSSNTVFELSSGLRLDRMSKKNAYLLLMNYNFVRAKNENFIDDGFAHLRYTRKLKKIWSWETFGQIQYNQKLNINFRGLLGTGPRVKLLEKEKNKIAAGLMLMYEYNELDAVINHRNDKRISSYLTIRLHPLEYMVLSSTTYYQPLLNDVSQSRVSTVNTIAVKISQAFSFTSSFSLVNDVLLAKEVVGVPATTYQWRNGLRLVF